MTTRTFQLLVIDDDAQIRRLLTMLLTAGGYQARTAINGAEGLRLAAERPPDLIILDLLMPDINGLDVCRTLREWYTGPILFLTVSTGDRAVITALDAGGDDFLTKPFSSGELLARVRALLRRAQSVSAVVRKGAVMIDLARRFATLNGAPVTFTPTEFDILAMLARRPGCIVTQRDILATIWGDGDESMLTTLRMHISNVRRKLTTSQDTNPIIETISRIGYRFHADEPTE